MNRVTNVSILVGLAAVLACAPSSRKQPITKAGADTSDKQKTPNGNDPGTTPGGGTTPPSGPAAPLPTSKVNVLQIKADGSSLELLIGSTSDANSKLIFTIPADGQNPTASNTAAVKAGSMVYKCKDSTTSPTPPSSLTCADGDFQFTVISGSNSTIDLDAKLVRIVNAPVSELITAQGSSTQNGSATPNFGTASVRKVTLTEASGTSSPLVAYSATIFAGGVKPTGQAQPDFVQHSVDGNSVIKVAGFPKKDSTGAAIIPPSAKSSNQELVAMVADGQLNCSAAVQIAGANSTALHTLILAIDLSGTNIASLTPDAVVTNTDGTDTSLTPVASNDSTASGTGVVPSAASAPAGTAVVVPPVDPAVKAAADAQAQALLVAANANAAAKKKADAAALAKQINDQKIAAANAAAAPGINGPQVYKPQSAPADLQTQVPVAGASLTTAATVPAPTAAISALPTVAVAKPAQGASKSSPFDVRGNSKVVTDEIAANHPVLNKVLQNPINITSQIMGQKIIDSTSSGYAAAKTAVEAKANSWSTSLSNSWNNFKSSYIDIENAQNH